MMILSMHTFSVVDVETLSLYRATIYQGLRPPLALLMILLLVGTGNAVLSVGMLPTQLKESVNSVV